MKVKTKKVPYTYAKTIQPPKRDKLRKPSLLFRLLIRILSIPDMLATKFSYTARRMKEVKKEPCLILMNHSSFIDLKIASKIFFPKPYYIVSTMDGFIGKHTLMRAIGCIPTRKFVADVALMRDISHALKERKTSVLLFPEAGYTFDGTTTTLPKNIGAFIKKLNVPLVTVITDGAFLRQPLYNNLRMRKTKVSAIVECVFNKEEIARASVEEINAAVEKAFSFDNFAKQAENAVVIDDEQRAEGLERILYRCPACNAEGEMHGEDIELTCRHCGKVYTMDEYGKMHANSGTTEFSHIPDWTAWERDCIRREIASGEYRMELDVDIAIIADHKAMYMVGEGKLTHDANGFVLQGCDGTLDYRQSPLAAHSLNADFLFYEIGDVVSIGDTKRLYYCFPKQKDVVFKLRFATEELYKRIKEQLADKNN